MKNAKELKNIANEKAAELANKIIGVMTLGIESKAQQGYSEFAYSNADLENHLSSKRSFLTLKNYTFSLVKDTNQRLLILPLVGKTNNLA